MFEQRLGGGEEGANCCLEEGCPGERRASVKALGQGMCRAELVRGSLGGDRV